MSGAAASAPPLWGSWLQAARRSAGPNGFSWPTGLDPNAPDQERRLALDAACELDCPEIARLICDLGGRFGELKSDRDRSPMHEAVLLNRPELIAWLWARGDGLDERERRGQRLTPLLLACSTGSFEAALALKDAGADPHAASVEGLSALGLCCLEAQEINVAFCLDHGLHARHELDDGGAGLEHQIMRIRNQSRPPEIERCFGMIRAHHEAREIGSVADDGGAVKKRPGL